jgi:hypothetical protein
MILAYNKWDIGILQADQGVARIAAKRVAKGYCWADSMN